jgi:hypothetical protein
MWQAKHVLDAAISNYELGQEDKQAVGELKEKYLLAGQDCW